MSRSCQPVAATLGQMKADPLEGVLPHSTWLVRPARPPAGRARKQHPAGM
jgi:hypothetical protein